MLNKIWPWSAIERYKKDAQNHAWLVRAAFERGHKSQGGDWREDWKETPERMMLVRWGYIKEEDTWR